MQIKQGELTAEFQHGQGYTSENASFAFWLSTTFPGASYRNAGAHKADLLAHGCEVDGEKPTPDPEPEVVTQVADEKKPTPVPHSHAYQDDIETEQATQQASAAAESEATIYEPELVESFEDAHESALADDR